MKVVAFLPVKGSSSRIQNKNIQLLDGKPLFLHALEKLCACDFINEVYLDTESDNIIQMASEASCKILKRDPTLATNATDGNTLFINEVRQVRADLHIQMLCTSPFIEENTLRNGVETLKSNSIYDSAVLVRSEKMYLWHDGKPSYNIEKIPNSVDLPSTTIETMGLYMVREEASLNLNRRIGDHPYLLYANPLEAIDVNWPEDFELANLIASGIREQDRKLLQNIKNHLTSSILSDVLDNLGYKSQIIRGVAPNISTAKIFGRAKTLRLRRLNEEEDFRGIYEALHSYETIVPNDVIIVESETPDYAYFGELNANLAIRSGAVGVIVGGKTRDSSEVVKTGLPVFSTGTSCQDVRGRATVDSINKTISVQGVCVHPGDLVYGDAEGVVVIPKSVEKRVIEEVFRIASLEKRILIDISMGVPIGNLVKNHGCF